MKAFDIFGGTIRVIENSIIPTRIPNFKLDPNVPLTGEARARHQAWLDDFFGTHEVALFFDASMVGIPGGPTIALRSELFQTLRTATTPGKDTCKP